MTGCVQRAKHPLQVPLTLTNPLSFARRNEPVTTGVPLARGRLWEVEPLRLTDAAGRLVPCQVQVAARWRDSSIKWLGLDFQASIAAAGEARYQLLADAALPVAAPAEALALSGTGHELRLQTGGVDFLLKTGAAEFLRLTGAEGAHRFRLPTGSVVERLHVEQQGPLRTEIRAEASLTPAGQARCLRCVLRLHFHAGKPSLRLLVTVHNPAAALHRDNYWDLGDPGSLLFEDISLVVEHGLAPPFVCSVDSRIVGEGELPARYLLYQDSSGGEHWNSENHVNREGEVPVRFRGYRLYAGAENTAQGDRAEGRVVLGGAGGALGVGLRHFWQNAPKSLEVSSESIRAGLFPTEFGDLHELQGGEQKTHEYLFARAPAPEEVDRQLQALQQPVIVAAPSGHYLETGVFQEQPPGNLKGFELYEATIRAVVRPTGAHRRTFFTQREVIDEYGWRHFGCVVADHEEDDRGICVGEKCFDGPISHYNNQYDYLFAAFCQFARTLDPAWFRLGEEGIRHLADIDVYHTQQDEPKYNGGMFWHTTHDVNAYRATHRTYPRDGAGRVRHPWTSGGPSVEHLYLHGLYTYYFLTGYRPALEAALECAEFALHCYDAYVIPYGPAFPLRGFGLALEAFTEAYQVTGEERFYRACLRTVEDAAFHAAERTVADWSLPMHMKALSRFLDMKAESGDEGDGDARRARGELLAYADFVVRAWDGDQRLQSLRFSDGLLCACKHCEPTDSRRAQYREMAAQLWHQGMAPRPGLGTYHFAKNHAIVLSNGYMLPFFVAQEEGASRAVPGDDLPP